MIGFVHVQGDAFGYVNLHQSNIFE